MSNIQNKAPSSKHRAIGESQSGGMTRGMAGKIESDSKRMTEWLKKRGLQHGFKRGFSTKNNQPK